MTSDTASHTASRFQALDLLSLLVAVLQSDGAVQFANAALENVLGLSRRVNDWFDPWLTIWNNIPALVLIVLCYLWIGLNETAAITAVACCRRNIAEAISGA